MMPANLNETSPTRWSLVRRLKDWDDQESWSDFFNTYWKLIYSAAMQSRLTDAEAQEDPIALPSEGACVEREMNTTHRHAAGGVASGTAVGLRRTVAAFAREG